MPAQPELCRFRELRAATERRKERMREPFNRKNRYEQYRCAGYQASFTPISDRRALRNQNLRVELASTESSSMRSWPT
jgi:hypothetical protein